MDSDELRAALEGATNGYKASARLEKIGDQELRPLIWALQYDYVEPDEVDRRATWGPWGPWVELDGQSVPPALDSIEDDDVTRWDGAAAELADVPVLAARLNDLLWERRWGDKPYQHALTAIDAYLELADSEPEPLERVMQLRRALELARQVKNVERQTTLVERIMAAAEESLAADEEQPGVALRLIEALAALPAEAVAPEAVGALLDAAEEAYDDPWILQSVLDLKVSRTTDLDEKRQLWREQVATWRSRAESATGVVRISFLRRAQEIASLYGLRDEEEAIGLEIQGISTDDLDLKTVSASVTITDDDAEAYIQAFIGDDWESSLVRFGGLGPPGGDYERNVAAVMQQMKDYPIQFMVSRVILGPGNMPIREISSEEEHREAALVAYESQGISIDAHFRADVLDRLLSTFGPLTREELTDLFTAPLMPAVLAERIARAVELYFDGQFDESGHVILPRLEAVIRNMVRELGLRIVQPPRGEVPGGVRALGQLLAAIQGHYDESWRRYMRNVLTEPTGHNIRNTALHGLVAGIRREQAALLIQIACHLRLIEISVAGEGEGPADPGDDTGES